MIKSLLSFYDNDIKMNQTKGLYNIPYFL